MIGAKFVTGLLSSGLQSQIAKAIEMEAEDLNNKTQLQEALQQGYYSATVNNAKQVKTAGEAMADVDQANANTQFAQGGMALVAPLGSIGYRNIREGKIQRFKPNDLTKIETEGTTIKGYQDSLHEETGLVSGQLPRSALQDPKSLSNLRHADFTKEGADPDKLLGTLKELRGIAKKDPITDEIDPINKGKLYNDVDEKLSELKKSNDNRMQSYLSDTDRRSQYLQSVGQSVQGLAGGAGGTAAAKAREDQAKEDSTQKYTEYYKDNQKATADQTQQAYQNTAQLYGDLPRILAEIGQANKM